MWYIYSNTFKHYYREKDQVVSTSGSVTPKGRSSYLYELVHSVCTLRVYIALQTYKFLNNVLQDSVESRRRYGNCKV